MKQVKLYTRHLCSWCMDAKKYLRRHSIPFEEIDVGHDPKAYEDMKQLSGQQYVPTIVVDDHVLANFDTKQLEKFLASINGVSR